MCTVGESEKAPYSCPKSEPICPAIVGKRGRLGKDDRSTGRCNADLLHTMAYSFEEAGDFDVVQLVESAPKRCFFVLLGDRFDERARVVILLMEGFVFAETGEHPPTQSSQPDPPRRRSGVERVERAGIVF